MGKKQVAPVEFGGRLAQTDEGIRDWILRLGKKNKRHFLAFSLDIWQGVGPHGDMEKSRSDREEQELFQLLQWSWKVRPPPSPMHLLAAARKHT
jgi:hypothetical protein